jgi:hypothetical protein
MTVNRPDSIPLDVRDLLIASDAPFGAGFVWVCACGVAATRTYTHAEGAWIEIDEHRAAAHHPHFTHDGRHIHPPMVYIVETVVEDEDE